MCDKKQPAEGMYQANEEGRGTNFMRGDRGNAGLVMGISGKGELKFRGFNAIAYTPQFVTFMLNLHMFPEQREYQLRKDDAHVVLSEAQHRREMIDLLERAGIVRAEVRNDRDFPYSVLVVDEEALRVYVSAVCNIGLPIKHWVPA